jgi:hypothetical protein
MAGLGFKYFNTNFSLMLGHPRMNPSVEVSGLPNNWWANLTAFTLVLMEWVNNVMLGLSSAGWLGKGAPRSMAYAAPEPQTVMPITL